MESQVPELSFTMALIINLFIVGIIFMIWFLLFRFPEICRSHNPAFYTPSSTNRPNGFDKQFCEILYNLGKLCGIDGSHLYKDSERTLDNDITPINGSYPGYHTIELKNGVVIAYGIDYYSGSKKIFMKRVVYKNEPVPEPTATELLQREYDFFKDLYEKERAKRNAELASLANWKGSQNA